VTSKSLFIATLVLVLLAGIYFYAGNQNQITSFESQRNSYLVPETRKPYVTIGRPKPNDMMLPLEEQVARDGLPMVRPLPPQSGSRSKGKDDK
jgi:hypothetical protein